jgi:uncharacterized repeat protein (TIGR01451 family)
MRTFAPFLFLLCLPAWPQAKNPASAKNLLENVPLSFELASPTTTSPRYVSRGTGYVFSVSGTEALLEGHASTVRMEFAGGNPRARIEPLEHASGATNYFLGNDPSKWRTDVSHFSRIAVRDVYPGIDFIFYGNGRQLEYDAVVAPGADPRKIRMNLSPAKDVTADASGDIVIKAGGSDLRLRKPVVYQAMPGGKQMIVGSYSLKKNGEVAFEVGDYDRQKPLVIDPVIVYSTYLQRGIYQANAIAADASGAVYVTGPADLVLGNSSGFAETAAYVTKIGPNGNLVYTAYIGGSSTVGQGIAVDSGGNAYVTGTTSMNFPVVNAFQPIFGGGPGDIPDNSSHPQDAFIAKLNAQGNAVIYSSYLGGDGNDSGKAIAVDSNGNAYIAGTTSGNFPVLNAIQSMFGGGMQDAFAVKVDAAGALSYSTYLGGTGIDFASGIAVDSNGNAVIVGYTEGLGFPTVSSLQPNIGGGIDVFITKINPQGSAFVYSTFLGGAGADYAQAVAVDTGGNAYVTGETTSTNFPIANAYQASPGGAGTGYSGFVTKLDASGHTLLYSTYLGGPGSSPLGTLAFAIAVDSSGNAYVTGETGPVFPIVNALQPVYGGGQLFDAFLTEFNATGGVLSSTFIGGAADETAKGIAVSGGNVYLAGYLSDSFNVAANFPVINAFQPILSGAFVMMISNNGASIIPPNVSMAAPTSDSGSTRNFVFTFSGGPGALSVVSADIDFGSSIGPVGACVIHYDPASNKVYLANDAGAFGSPSLLPFAGTLENSQCSINTGISFASLNGNAITLALWVTLKPAYAGVKTIYLKAANSSLDSGWIPAGTYYVTTPTTPDFTLSMSPTSLFLAQGQTGAYRVTVNPSNGFNGLVDLKAVGSYYGVSASFNPASIQSSGSSDLTFTASAVASIITGGGVTVTGTSGPLSHQTSAAINIVGAPHLPSPMFAAPGTGGFTFIFADPAGIGDIVSAQVEIGASQGQAPQCRIFYDSKQNLLYLADDSNTLQLLSPGTTQRVENSQCAINAASTFARRDDYDLTMNVALSFKPTFAGTKNIYMDLATANYDSGWILKHTFTAAPLENLPPAALSVLKSHTGSFTQGQSNATYVVTVLNSPTAGPTTGTVTLTEGPPSGLTLVSMSGNGWSCASTQCSRSDALLPGASYPPITVTVNVAPNASTPLVNSVFVSGGGSAQSGASDSTDIFSATASPGIASFVRVDAATQGNWRGVYGSEGYVIAGDQTLNPTSVAPVLSGQSLTVWAPSTTDMRALQKASNPSDRVAATWYAGNSFLVDLNFADGGPHTVALYFLDWDTTSRRQTVDILSSSGVVLTSQSFTTSFHDGVYLVWNMAGHVKVRVTVTGGANPVLSGIFIGGSNSPGNSPGTATFIGADTSRQGNWAGQYGSEGFLINGLPAQNPPYVAPVAQGATPFVWTNSTADVRALQSPFNNSTRIASGWYSGNSFLFDLPFTDANTHELALYCLDWDSTSRRETVDILDGNGNVLNSQNLAGSFNGGVYLLWNVSGHVKVRVTLTAGTNPVLSGLFFGPAANGNSPTPALSITKTHSGNFALGQQGVTYTITVSNAANAGATSGPVTVVDNFPAGLTFSSLSGSGWFCSLANCTRSDSLAPGASYPPITGLFGIASNAGSPQVNQVTVSGGGSASATANDSTIIVPIGPSTSTAAFVGTDTATKGNWRGVYGGDGYAVVGDQQVNPSYVTPLLSGQNPYTWVPSTIDVRGLQKGTNSSDRIAAAWYTTNFFIIDLPVTDSTPHQVALYLLDWDTTDRRETITVLDANGQFLGAQAATTSFNGGVYYVWNITGHVKIRVDLAGGANAVVSGLFFGGASVPVNPGTPSASFVKLDSTTQGSWHGVYGGEGYTIVGDQSLNPTYVTPSPSGQVPYTWVASSGDVRALQKASGTDRIAGVWYSGSTFSVDLPFTDSSTHQLALYLLDWDTTGRRETVDILDANNNVLNSQNVTSSFNGGVYLVWNVSGHVKVRISLTGGANPVLSGLFFGAGTTSPPVTSTPAVASFVKIDTTTQGNWHGNYGLDGYNIIGDQSLNPAYVTPSASGQIPYTWISSTSDVRGLQKPLNLTDRLAGVWYTGSSMVVDLPFTDALTHQLAIYCLDWDTTTRRQTVDILDANGSLLNSQNLSSSFSGGVYLVWNVSGHVKVRVTLTGGTNAVLSGVFFR